MMLTRSTVALVVLGLGTLTACDKLAEAVADKAAAAAVEAQQAGMTEDDKLGDKLAGYIDCINNTSRRIGDAEDRYLDWVDPKVGITGKEKNVYGLYEISDQSTCINGIKTAADAEPDDPETEGAATEYLAALEAVMPLVNEAHKYYDEEDYKDDKFAKGKELHPKLVAAFEKFGTADDKFRKLVVDKNEALQERELARVEKEEGKKLSFHNKFVMSKAKKLVEASDVKDLKELDLAKYEVVLGEFEKAVDELEAYVKDHKAEADSVSMFSSFVGKAGEMRKAAKELMRRKRDKPEFTADEIEYLNQGHTHLVEGNPGAVLKVYNDLVGDSNRLNWHFYKPDGV
jgi:hypothetical protein